MSPERLQEIKDRLEAATPGPWLYAQKLIYEVEDVEVVGDGDVYRPAFPAINRHPMWIGVTEEKEDGVLIAHARQDLADLVAEVERLREERADLARRLEARSRDVREVEERAQEIGDDCQKEADRIRGVVP